jgi:CRP-like cAMP-binding protein
MLRVALICFVGAVMIVVPRPRRTGVQSAACNGRHPIEQRLARWLLTTLDRVEGDSFAMTQEFMSDMLGVRRPGVTLAIGALQRAGLVRHEKRTMHVLNRPHLEAASCECHDIVRRRFAWLMDN